MAQLKHMQLSGIVTDSLSLKQLPNASIYLKNNNGSDQIHTTANEKGGFTFNSVTEGRYRLIVEYIGYESFSLNILINENNPPSHILRISLALKGIDLKDVKITGRVNKPLIISTGGKIILNVAQNPLNAGDDAYSVLLRAPGVVELNGSLVFRNKSVNVLIDDKPTHLSDDELRNMLSAMSANGIERIEIISNPSAKYDAQGGSIINIILSKNKQEGTNGVSSTSIGTGRYLKYNEDISLNYRNKQLNIYGSYDFMHNKQYLDNTANRIIDAQTSIYQNGEELRSRFNNSYQLGLDYDISKRSTVGISFRGYTNYGKRTVETQSDLIHQNIADSVSISNTKGNVRFSNPSFNVYYNQKFDSLGTALAINADYLNYHKTWKDNFATDYYDANGHSILPTNYLRDDLPGKITNYSFSTDYSQLSKIGKLEYGVRSQVTQSDNDQVFENQIEGNWNNDTTKSNRFIYKENINAAYFNYTNTFGLKYTLTLGIRAEQTNTEGNLVTENRTDKKHYLSIFPNINFNYAVSVNGEFNLTYRKSIERFGLNIVNPFLIYQNQYAYSQGNPNIHPQINHNFELIYTYKKAFIFGTSYTRSVNAIAPVYIKGVDNIVISTFNNLKSADLFYVYYDLMFPVTPWWTTDFSGGAGFLRYNTSSSIYRGNNATWSYLLQTENTFNFGKGWAAIFNVLDRGPYASGTYKLQTIFTSSTGISKTLAQNKIAFKLSLLDIFNTEKQKVRFSYQDLTIDQINKTETRFLTLTFTYKFGNTKLKSKPVPPVKNQDTQNRLNN